MQQILQRETLPKCSVKVKEADVKKMMDAFRRAKNKFAGGQKIIVSNKWGFTNLTRLEDQNWMKEGSMVSDGVGVKMVRKKNPLAKCSLFQALERAERK